MEYKIFEIAVKTVCAPSSDYYARSNDWQSEDVNVLEPVFMDEPQTFLDMESAAAYAKKCAEDINKMRRTYDGHKYRPCVLTVLPVITAE